MGRKKEKFRQTARTKRCSIEIQQKMKELKRLGKSREETCSMLKIPLIELRSWQRYTSTKTDKTDEQSQNSCQFNRPFKFTQDALRVEFEKTVVSTFRQKSKSRGFPQTMLKLTCEKVQEMDKFKNDPHLKTPKFSWNFINRLMRNHGLSRTYRKSNAKLGLIKNAR